MTKKAKDESKAGHKSLRMRRRVQFAVEFWARWEGLSDTAFIEQAAEAHARSLAAKYGVRWARMFHPHAGVRWLRTYLLEEYPLTDAHEARRAFAVQHRDFFFVEHDGAAIVQTTNVQALFPHAVEDDAFLDAFDKLCASTGDVWAPGRTMASALRAKGISPPTWPPASRAATA